MTTSTSASSVPIRVRPPAAVLPAVAALLYAGVQLDAGVVVASLRSTSTVSHKHLNFPLSGSPATTAEIVWGLSQLAFLVALAAFRRAPVLAGSRAGRAGATLAFLGGWLFLGGHLMCLAFRDALTSDAAGVTASSLFGVGSVLIAAGFVAAGIVVLRGNQWTSWRRLTPLALGGWMVVMIPLQFTNLLQVAVAVHAVTVAAFAVAMLLEAEK